MLPCYLVQNLHFVQHLPLCAALLPSVLPSAGIVLCAELALCAALLVCAELPLCALLCAELALCAALLLCAELPLCAALLLNSELLLLLLVELDAEASVGCTGVTLGKLSGR